MSKADRVWFGSRPTGIAGAAALVAVVTAISRIAGFGREAVIAAVFGASADLDAYLVATGVPNVVIALLSTVAVTAFIPEVSRRVRGGDVAGGHRLFRTVAAGVIVALGLGSLLMAVFAPAVVRLMAPGFAAPQLALAASITRVLLIATVLVAGMNLVSGLLHIHGRFFWPAFVGLPFNAAMVVAAVGFGRQYGVTALAIGFVVGSALRVIVQLPAMARAGFRWRGRLELADPGVRAVTGLIPVIALAHLTGNVNAFVDRIVGSGLEPGAISALNYAYRLVTLPKGLFVVALIQVLYPALGAAATATMRARFGALLGSGLRMLLVLLVPIAVALVVLAEPVVTFVYQRGAFTPADAVRTASALAAYAPGLVAVGVRDLGIRALYGLGDTRTPAVTAVTAMLVNVAGDLVLGPLFGVAGLGAATTLSYLVAAGLVWRALARRHGALRMAEVSAPTLRALVIAPLSAGAMLAVHALTGGGGGFMARGAVLAVALTVGALVHVSVLSVLRAPEARELLGAAGRAWARLRGGQPTRRT